MLNDTIKISLSPNVILRDNDDKNEIYNTKTETVIELNSVGADIIQKIKVPVTFRELITYCSEKYHISTSDVKTDIYDFLETCHQKGCIVYKE